MRKTEEAHVSRVFMPVSHLGSLTASATAATLSCFPDNSKFQLLRGLLYPELFPEPLPLTCELLSHTGPHTRGVNTLPGATPPVGDIRYWRNTPMFYQGTKFSGTFQQPAQSC